MVSVVGLMVTPRVSLSVMLTVDSSTVPSVTRGGSVPKLSFTFSPSSSMSSSVAVKVKVLLVSPVLKVMSVGTPE